MYVYHQHGDGNHLTRSKDSKWSDDGQRLAYNEGSFTSCIFKNSLGYTPSHHQIIKILARLSTLTVRFPQSSGGFLRHLSRNSNTTTTTTTATKLYFSHPFFLSCLVVRASLKEKRFQEGLRRNRETPNSFFSIHAPPSILAALLSVALSPSATRN